ncbi:MAG: hypothetical protein ACUVTG_11105, partial [Candidatus Oleimicrobiaceae bacterium]
QGLVSIGVAVLDELRGARAICRVTSVRSPYNVQPGDWLVESGGRTPAAQPSSADGAAKPRVVAVRGDKVMIAGSCAPWRPGNRVAIEGLGRGGSRLIGTVRLSQVQAELAVASIVSEGPGAEIRPGHWVAVTLPPAQQGEAAKVSPRSCPRVATVTSGYALLEGLPEQWPVGSVLEVVRQDGHDRPPVARLRLAQRRGDRGVATLRKTRQGRGVQPGDLVVLPLPPAAISEDLDTYFFGSYRP